jgi:hypothetical protein
MIIAQIFLLFGQDATVLLWVGAFVASLGVLFVALHFQPPVRHLPSEAVQ